MTNINCTRECIFQKEGICSYDNTTYILTSVEGTCGEMTCAYQRKDIPKDKKIKPNTH